MAVLRLGRFRAGPAGTGNAHQGRRPGRRGRGCLSRAHRSAAGDAGDQKQAGVWRRASLASVQAVLPAHGAPPGLACPSVPAAAARH
jgi:hypothetical protein